MQRGKVHALFEEHEAVRTLSNGVEGEMSKEDKVSLLSVSQLKVERLVGLLVPVG